MKKPVNRQASVDSRRIALEREIKLSFPAFDTFVTEYSANISTTGMFVVSEEPKGPGAEFNFEFSVADDWKLIRGKGQVVWARHKSDGPHRPPGMGIRFLELDPQSRRLIRWIVEKHIREGGKPFELEELRSVVDEALEQAALQSPPAREVAERPQSASFPEHVSAMRSTRPPSFLRRRVLGWIGAAAVGAAIVLLVWLSEVAPRMTAARDAASPDATTAEAATPAQDSGAEPGAAEGAQEETAVLPTPAEAARTVQAWAAAWSEQDVEGYLAHYSSGFEPPNGLARQAWRAQRAERLTRPRFIRIAIRQLETTLGEQEDRALARFFQSYRSDTYSDEVLKVLELEWEEGGWKIAAERVVG